TALRERIRYSAVLNSASGWALSIPRGGLGWNLNFQKALAERPTTINSLVFDFRQLVQEAARVVSAPIVIAVDELDNLRKRAGLARLLTDVKAVLDVPGVHFFVSVSDEAANSLLDSDIRLGSRDVFSSSFYTVIDVPSLSVQEAAALVSDRSGESLSTD